MPNTYTELATQTLGTAATSVTFSSIPATYTDLFLVATTVGASLDALVLQFNADTGTNYSTTILYGTGSSAASARETNSTYVYTGLSGSAMSQSTYNIMNYANTTTFKTTIGRGDAANGQVRAGVSLWRSTSAINSIKVFRTANNNMDAGSTFSLYGIAAAPVWAAKATGGTITNDVQYTYHTFTSSGTFTPSQALIVDYLVVAGGGSGGGGTIGGGGGAGGYRTGSGFATANGTPLTVTVGGGGASTSSLVAGNNGSNSVFSSITSTGGGGGGLNGTPTNAGSGGSGGGSGEGTSSPGAGNAGSYSPVEGYAGGNASDVADAYGSGGGGGASAVGGAGSSTNGGTGGAGTTSSIGGTSVTYAGGGGGGVYGASTTPGAGGAGGGGAGGNYGTPSTGTNGTANRGAGGGGTGSGASGAGGSGIVIIRYEN